MRTKDIRASLADAPVACDVCGRTLLRGERAHAFLEGGTHRSVCELCTARAQQEGWIREGTVPAYDGRDSGSDRRRSLLGRLRRRRDGETASEAIPRPLEEPSVQAGTSPERPARRRREPRHVRAVPSSPQQRISSAIAAFNSSEHPRTVAGVARSLGLPIVSVRPRAGSSSMVRVVVAWELCWYRYEIDLADEDGGVRAAGQGNELHELEADEREPNVVCDDRGLLAA